MLLSVIYETQLKGCEGSLFPSPISLFLSLSLHLQGVGVCVCVVKEGMHLYEAQGESSHLRPPVISNHKLLHQSTAVLITHLASMSLCTHTNQHKCMYTEKNIHLHTNRNMLYTYPQHLLTYLFTSGLYCLLYIVWITTRQSGQLHCIYEYF